MSANRGPNHDRRQFATPQEFEEYRERIHERYRWRFGEWSFDWIDRTVQPGDIYVDPRMADVLRILCESLSVPLSGGEIALGLSRINPDDTVNPENIRTIIKRLRDAIGEERIRSQGQRGYRFVPFP